MRMLSFFISWIFVAVICLRHISSNQFSDYLVTNRVNRPSYLFTEFPTVGESIFPKDINVNISLTYASGILLYSVDTNGNQFIIHLDLIRDGLITFEIRTEKFNVSMESFCGCTQCLYKPLVISTEIDQTLKVQCNGRPLKIFQINNKPFEFNKDYPNIYSTKATGITNKAALWIVNTERNLNERNKQLQGCLFSIQYKKSSFFMSPHGPDIKSTKCQPICGSDQCKGGECLETYSNEPICNCTRTFGSGRTCTDESKTINKKYNQRFLPYSSIKLSCRCNTSRMWEIGNSRTNLALRKDNGDLVFVQTFNGNVTRSERFSNIPTEKKYVLVITFGMSIELELMVFNSPISMSITRTLPNMVNQQVFDYLILQSGKGGVIDIAFKSRSTDVAWEKIPLNEASSEDLLVDGTGDNSRLFPLLVLLLLLLLPVIVVPVLQSRRKVPRDKSTQRGNPTETEFIPLMEMEPLEKIEIIHFQLYSLICWKDDIHTEHLTQVIKKCVLPLKRPVVIYKIPDTTKFTSMRLIQLEWKDIKCTEFVAVASHDSCSVTEATITEIRDWSIEMYSDKNSHNPIQSDDFNNLSYVWLQVQPSSMLLEWSTCSLITIVTQPEDSNADNIYMFLSNAIKISNIRVRLREFLKLLCLNKIQTAIGTIDKTDAIDTDVINTVKRFIMLRVQPLVLLDAGKQSLSIESAMSATTLFPSFLAYVTLQRLERVEFVDPINDQLVISGNQQTWSEWFLAQSVTDENPSLVLQLNQLKTAHDICQMIKDHLKVNCTILLTDGIQIFENDHSATKMIKTIHYVTVKLKSNLTMTHFNGKIYQCTIGEENFAAKQIARPYKAKKEIVREIAAITRIGSHPRIMQYRHLYEDGNYYYIVMDLMKMSLRQFAELKKKDEVDPLREEKVKQISQQLLEGLKHLHSLNIIHGNLKGSNVLLADDEATDIKLSDFGSSEIERTATNGSRNRKGKISSTTNPSSQISPEVDQDGNVKLTFKTDIWSFGETIIELITGETPFRGSKTEDIKPNVQETIQQIERNSPGRFTNVINKLIKPCLNIEDSERPTCQAMLLYDIFKQADDNTETDNE